MRDKWILRLKLKRLSRYVILVCLVFLLTLAGFTLYGDRAGNFVVVIKEDKVKIAACLTKNFESDLTSRFDVPGIEYLSATTYQELPDSISSGIGVKNDEHNQYMAFSFYLINFTERAVNYDLSIEILDELAGNADDSYKPSDALRILILTESELNEDFEGSASLKADGEVYARKEDSQEGIDELKPAGYPDGKVIDFLEGDTIVKTVGNDFDEDGILKFTVVIWLEGYDISCKPELIGGRLKMKMSINAYLPEN